MTAAILGNSPAGFSASLRQHALDLRTRMQNGETIPLSELKAFILEADADLSTSRAKRANPPKSTDVDFF